MQASTRDVERRGLARGLSGPLIPPGCPRDIGAAEGEGHLWNLALGTVRPTVGHRAESVARHPARIGAAWHGGRGGGAPRQPLSGACGAWPHRVGWLACLLACLTTLAWLKPASGRPRRHLSGHRPEQRPPGHRRQAPRPRGRQPHGRRGRTGRPVTPRRWRHSLPRGPFPPYPYPSGTGDRRSQAILGACAAEAQWM